MAQSNQATPTLQANLGGVGTTVNLRDWLNTRLSPFLKRAIIESLESEAQFPLQWLGEHLIQQSIQFEGNPDSTKIRERFVYEHEIKPSTALAQNAGLSQASVADEVQEQHIPAHETQNTPVTGGLAEPVVQDELDVQSSTAITTETAAVTHEGLPPTASINGTSEAGTNGQGQDTDMTNTT